jgi:hypothetical protein
MKRLLLAAVLVLTGCSSHQAEPGDVFNQHARLNGPLPYPVLSWSALTTSVNRLQQTSSTLFGDTAAVAAARGGQASYPQGAVVALVTWHETEDPHWFGARIPGEPAQVEVVEFTASGPKYRLFTGSPLTEQTSPNGTDRIAAIAGMKAVIFP